MPLSSPHSPASTHWPPTSMDIVHIATAKVTQLIWWIKGRFPSKLQAGIAQRINQAIPFQETSAVQENPNASDANKRFYFDTFSCSGINGTDTGDNGIVITQEYSMDKSIPETVGEIGTGLEVTGLGITLTTGETGVGAAVGAAVAKVGGTMSTISSLATMGADIINGDYGSAILSGACVMGSKLLDKGIDNLVPSIGSSDINNQSNTILRELKDVNVDIIGTCVNNTVNDDKKDKK